MRAIMLASLFGLPPFPDGSHLFTLH